jgi:hypothetical protein
MAPVLALALLCVSSVETFGKITVVNRLPSACTEYLGSPPLPVSELPAAVAPPVVEPKAEPPKIVEKPVVKKKSTKRKRCRPGRTRNAAGICGRWR